jgi:hypothetical protein
MKLDQADAGKATGNIGGSAYSQTAIFGADYLRNFKRIGKPEVFAGDKRSGGLIVKVQPDLF